jgi:hypothetical protein
VRGPSLAATTFLRPFVSFDIFAQDLPPDAKKVSDIPDNFLPKSIGRRADIIAGIFKAAPTVDFSDPAWGTIDGPGFSIEVGVAPEEEIKCVAFHVRGGAEALSIISNILIELGVRALAPGTASGFFVDSEIESAYSRWQAYRKQIGDSSDDAG